VVSNILKRKWDKINKKKLQQVIFLIGQPIDTTHPLKSHLTITLRPIIIRGEAE
jgi:hypothetical protein